MRRLIKGQTVACTFYGGLWKVDGYTYDGIWGQYVNIVSVSSGITINVKRGEVVIKSDSKFNEYAANDDVL